MFSRASCQLSWKAAPSQVQAGKETGLALVYKKLLIKNLNFILERSKNDFSLCPAY